ncbi:MAG: TIGR03668 family PPOX class F420-dependent oxidoreductase [Dehalococcoidia bacterium]
MTRLSPTQAQLLAAAPVGHLATAAASGAPHVIPVCFASDGQSIYSVLDQKPKRTSLTRLRRVRNILENPQVALVVDHYEADWNRLWYLLITGRGELLLEGEERGDAVRLLRQKYVQYREMEIDANPVIKITPQRIVSWGGAG